MSKNRHKRQVEPFVMLGTEILNSPAYIDLSFSARALLIEVIRCYRGNNNGSIFISMGILKERGFSKNTASKAFRELTSHGMLYMTKRGGKINGGCSTYAITWQRINRTNNQFLNEFTPNAYKNWTPTQKINGSKIGVVQTQNLGFMSTSTSIP